MSMTNRDIYRTARVNLNGVYRVAIGAFLLANIAVFAIEIPFQYLETDTPTTTQLVISYIVPFLIGLLGLLLTVGQYAVHLKLARLDETNLPGTTMVFSPFKNHPDRYLLCGLLLMAMGAVCLIPFGVGYYLYTSTHETLLLLILIVLAAVSVVCLFYVVIHFSFSLLLLLDQPDITVMDSVKKSWELTSGKTKELCHMFLYFLVLYLLAAVSFGFALVWITPYQMQIMTVCYLDLIGEPTTENAAGQTIDVIVE